MRGRTTASIPATMANRILTWKSRAAWRPMRTVDFVIGTPTFLVDGITNSFEYIIENNLADIISSSYGDCEGNEGVGGNEFNAQAFEQAAAQGISIFIADGDNGPAECDDQNDSLEVLGYAAAGGRFHALQHCGRRHGVHRRMPDAWACLRAIQLRQILERDKQPQLPEFGAGIHPRIPLGRSEGVQRECGSHQRP